MACMSCLCVDMLFLYLNNMLCCLCDALGSFKMAAGLLISPCELILGLVAMKE